MRIIKHLAAAAAVIAIAAGAAGAQERTIRIAMDATYPPFESLDPSGEIVGFEKDIGEALCERMKAKCEFINVAWEGIIPGLQANKYDAILSSMSMTEERKQQIDFSDKIYNTPAAVGVPNDSEIKGITPEDLAGASIGTQVSTIHAIYVEQKLPESELKTYPSPDEYKLDLANGRLDAVVDDVVVLDAWIKSEAGSCCRILGMIENIPEIHGEGTGVGLRKEDTELKEMINKAIAEIRADGTYQKINEKYFAFDAYGS